jgi:hypothetical protein
MRDPAIPSELDVSTLNLPSCDLCSIVVITGTELRHDRFALRVQAEFPQLVSAWLQVVPASPKNAAAYGKNTEPPALASRLVRRRLEQSLPRMRRLLGSTVRPERLSLKIVEEQLFGEEIDELKSVANVAPTTIPELSSPSAIALLKSLDPYFILVLGDSISGPELRGCSRGLALKQNDGWCPEYGGSFTIDWALCHRDLARITNSVYIVTDSLDPARILRTAITCLAEDDTPESCFARSVALGTELMCETVRELLRTKEAHAFRQQPRISDNTCVETRMTENVRHNIRRDLQRGLIKSEIARRTAF